MAKELRLEQRLGDRGAVERDERPAASSAVHVQRPRHELLPRAGLAGNHHGGIRARQPFNRLVDAVHRRALADEVVGQANMGAEPVGFEFDAREVTHVLERDRGDRRDRRHQLEVAFVEHRAAAARGDIDRGQHMAADDERHADERANVCAGEAGGGAERLAGGNIAAQNPDPPPRHFRHHRAADSHRGGARSLPGAGVAELARLPDEDDGTGIARDDLEDVVEDLSKQIVLAAEGSECSTQVQERSQVLLRGWRLC